MANAPEKSTALEKRIKKHVIGKPHRFIAVAPLGFENALVEELKFIGIECGANYPENELFTGIEVVGDGKVEFTAKLTEAWKAIANSRIANRILMEIESFKAENFGQLQKHATEVPWELYLRDCKNLHLHTTCKHSRLYHSEAIEERIRLIIEQAIEASLEEKESVGGEQHLYINFTDDRCTLRLDLAGEELYKRGQNRHVAEAPLKETLAAAMLWESGFYKSALSKDDDIATLIDPMAGSGTFSLEAAYIANGLIPGKCRDFALMEQPAFKENAWNYILKSVATGTTKIFTSDISDKALEIIKYNFENCPLADFETNSWILQKKDFFSYEAMDIPENSFIMLNPPYGKRLDFNAPKLYTRIGMALNEITSFARKSNKKLSIAILAPKGACKENLQRECPSLDPEKNAECNEIETSHGGFSLSAIFLRY